MEQQRYNRNSLMLSLTRGTAAYHRMLSKAPFNAWRFADAPLVQRLRGAVFGVIGMGIGMATARVLGPLE